jgi:dolichol-phosphate mannosyltransferase
MFLRSSDLSPHQELVGAVSFVIPCHNEAMNVRPIVEALVRWHDRYIHEIIVVDDNSSDQTADVTRELHSTESRVKLVVRERPAGVGRALRDGYAAASGRFILSMDCDFVEIVREFQGLFDAVATGYDGAVGSRFSRDSLVVGYPWPKLLANRGFHLLLNLTLRSRMRDVSNNLKLYRAEILQEMRFEETGFAANVETGLMPILAGNKICEVPVSWIGRTKDMGTSSFNILRVGPGYIRVICRTIWRKWATH